MAYRVFGFYSTVIRWLAPEDRFETCPFSDAEWRFAIHFGRLRSCIWASMSPASISHPPTVLRLLLSKPQCFDTI